MMIVMMTMSLRVWWIGVVISKILDQRLIRTEKTKLNPLPLAVILPKSLAVFRPPKAVFSPPLTVPSRMKHNPQLLAVLPPPKTVLSPPLTVPPRMKPNPHLLAVLPLPPLLLTT